MILQELDLKDLELSQEDNSIILRMVSVAFWVWYNHNQEKTITLKIWFIRKKFKYRDLCNVFVLLFGEPPAQ